MKRIALVLTLCLFGLDNDAFARGGGGRGGGRGGGSSPRSGNRNNSRQNRRQREERKKQAEQDRQEKRAALVAEARLIYAKREREEAWTTESNERLANVLARLLRSLA